MIKDASLGTPALHDACEERLLGVVRNVGPEAIDRATKVSVGIANNLGRCHAWLERVENRMEGRVKELPSKFAELEVVIVSTVR